MDPKEELSKSVCTNILQKSIRQQRYRLKRDYVNDRTVEEALANKPPNLSQENWEALVNKWSDPGNKVCSKITETSIMNLKFTFLAIFLFCDFDTSKNTTDNTNIHFFHIETLCKEQEEPRSCQASTNYRL